jgi:hypothetical protein
MATKRPLGSTPWANGIALLLGGGFLLAGVGLVGVSFILGGIGGLAMLIFLGLPTLATAALLLAPVVAEGTGQILGAAVYYPRLSGTLPPEFSLIKAKIAAHEYVQAQQELEERLSDDPGNPILVALLAELLMDKLQDYRSTAGLLAVYFERHSRNPEDGPLALRLADAYLELGKTALAKTVLSEELGRQYLKKGERCDLQRRLDGLNTEQAP